MDASEFYGNVGDPFAATSGRPTPHRGVDFPWGAGTGIPAWDDGVVALNQWSAALGHMLSIRTADGWAGFCHLQSASPLSVGEAVKFGQIIGHVGNTGSASRGNHLHATFSETGASPAFAAVVDPLPRIQASIKRHQNGSPMKIIYCTGISDDNTRRALVGELSFDVITANESIQEAKLWGTTTNVDLTTWNGIKARVNRRRGALGLPATGGSGGGASAAAVADEFAQRLASGGAPR